jgi:predicted AlkP superfamily phosphohydrolase/phosphomutase
MSGRVIVIGLDGGTWSLLDLLAEAGQMPNLADLLKSSVHAPMRSVQPPVTAPAWVTLATGVNPGRHGCFDFNKPDGSLSKLRPLQSWDIAEKTFYEILEERGRKCVLVNLPVSCPPLTKHVTLTSLLTQGEDAVFPPEMKMKYPVLSGYRIFPDTRLRVQGRLEEYLKDVRAVEKARFACVQALWKEPWDCFFVLFSGTDWVSHEAFPDLAEGRFEKQRDAVGLFEDVDRCLGWFAEQLGPEDHLLLVSDHGFRAAKGIFYLNEWLEEEGYLVPDYSRPSFPPTHQMEARAQDALQGKAARIPASLLRTAHEKGSARLFAKAYRKFGGVWPVSLTVDIGASRASTLTAECMGVTIHDTERSSEGPHATHSAAALREKLRVALQRLEDPEGELVFWSVEKREDVYSGPETEKAADLLLGPGPWGVAAAIKALKNIPFVFHPTGIHSSEGIFLGHGRGFGQGRFPSETIGLQDVAPFIFYFLGEAIPQGLDGRLVSELMMGGQLGLVPPRYAPVFRPRRARTDLDAEAIQERLRGLGYMG